jgi:hypothetical protein
LSYIVILLNIAFKICQQIQKKKLMPLLKFSLLFRCNLTNRQTCQSYRYYSYLKITYSRIKQRKNYCLPA